MTSSFVTQAEQGIKAPPPLAWRVWPLGDRRWRTALAVTVMAAAGALVAWKTADPRAGALALAALLLATWRLWVPIRYELGAVGVTRKLWRGRRIPWHAIHRWQVHHDGVLLLFDPDPAPLDPLHGLYLPWGPHREEVLAVLDYYLKRRLEPKSQVLEKS